MGRRTGVDGVDLDLATAAALQKDIHPSRLLGSFLQARGICPKQSRTAGLKCRTGQRWDRALMSLQRTIWAMAAYVELAGDSEADANRDVYRVRIWLRDLCERSVREKGMAEAGMADAEGRAKATCARELYARDRKSQCTPAT